MSPLPTASTATTPTTGARTSSNAPHLDADKIATAPAQDPDASNTAAVATCPKCTYLVAAIQQMRADYQYNLDLIASRDKELAKWDDREAWWKLRWKTSCLEKEQLEEKVARLTADLAAAHAETSRATETAQAESAALLAGRDHAANAQLRDLQTQLHAEKQRHATTTSQLTALQSQYTDLDTSLRTTTARLTRADAARETAELAAQRARDAERTARADRDAALAAADRAKRDADAAVAAHRAQAADVKRVVRRVAGMGRQLEEVVAEGDKWRAEAETARRECEDARARIDAERDAHAREIEAMRVEVADARRDAAGAREEVAAVEAKLAKAKRAHARAVAAWEAKWREEVGARRHDQDDEDALAAIEAEWDAERAELVAENDELVKVVRAMRDEMEVVARTHDEARAGWERERGELETRAAKEVERVKEELGKAVKERDEALAEVGKKVDEIRAFEDRVKLMSAAATATVPPWIWPGTAAYGSTTVSGTSPWLPTAPGTGPWPPTAIPPFGFPPSGAAPPTFPIAPTAPAPSADAVAALQAQLAETSDRVLALLDERERLIDRSNALRAELRHLRDEHDAYVAPPPPPPGPEMVESGVQTDPILAVSTSLAVRKKRAALGGAKAAPVATKPAAVRPAETVVVAVPDEEEKRAALARLRKRGLRNWNDVSDVTM
ncbi:hypothetical protein GGF31_003782 [Allomyces arbusculus]|nr:hypothetical protein GGF31_003782 [Allomyces arbusculus]